MPFVIYLMCLRAKQSYPEKLYISTNIQQGIQNTHWTVGKGQCPQQMVLEILDKHMQKNEAGPLSHTTHRNELKMDQRLIHKTSYHKTPRRK